MFFFRLSYKAVFQIRIRWRRNQSPGVKDPNKKTKLSIETKNQKFEDQDMLFRDIIVNFL